MNEMLANYDNSVQVWKKNGRYFMIYDAGGHQVIMREDEISEEEANFAIQSLDGAVKVLWEIRRSLLARGIKQNFSNI